jgi:hypothetical protein
MLVVPDDAMPDDAMLVVPDDAMLVVPDDAMLVVPGISTMHLNFHFALLLCITLLHCYCALLSRFCSLILCLRMWSLILCVP